MRTNYIKKQIQKIKKQRKYNERKIKKKLTLTWEDVDAETATEVDVEDVAKKLKETQLICPQNALRKVKKKSESMVILKRREEEGEGEEGSKTQIKEGEDGGGGGESGVWRDQRTKKRRGRERK